MNELSVKQGVSEHTLNSWEEFGGYIASAHANSPAYLYRGQADVEWRVESALDRMESRYPKTKNYWGKNPEYFDCPPAARDVHLEAFKEAVRGKRGPSPHELSEDEWWALAQHHGLATPLLDWTYSPFVALFFAFEHEGYVNFTTQSFQIPDRRAVYFVPFHLITQNGTDADPAPSVFSPRREISHRLSSQSGVFMRMPKGSDLESSVRRRFPDESSTNNRHARAILLDDLQRGLFDFLVRRKPPAALAIQAFPPATNDKLLAGTRVDDFRFGLSTERTEHRVIRSRGPGFPA
jgi:hypothetical protein